MSASPASICKQVCLVAIEVKRWTARCKKSQKPRDLHKADRIKKKPASGNQEGCDTNLFRREAKDEARSGLV